MIKKIIISLTILAILVVPVGINLYNPNNIIAINAVEAIEIITPLYAATEELALPEAKPLSPIDLLMDIIELFQFLAIIVAVLFIIFGAFNFITAGGDDKKIEQGRNAIMYALIAVVVVVVAQGIVWWVAEWAGL